MEVVLGIIGVIIFFAMISSLGKGADKMAARKQYDNAISASTGLEKIRLICRREGIGYSLIFPKNGDRSPSFAFTVPTIQLNFADAFYGLMEQMYKDIDREDPFKEPAESSDFRKTISARLFGVSFGIALEKVATATGKKVKKTAVKDYIKRFTDIDEAEKKEMVKMAVTYIDYMNDKLFGARTDVGWTSMDLGYIAYALLGMKLEKGNFADPMIATQANLALMITFKNADVSSIISDAIDNKLVG